MKKKMLLLPLLVFGLASCSKTNLLYKENAYNSPVFDENYYTEWEGIDKLQVSSEINSPVFWSSEDGLNVLIRDGFNEENFKWSSLGDKNEEFGYNHNLDLIEEDFNYGVLSKLYDGRVRCEGYYQKSRVQLDKTGYATYFPKSLVSAKYIAFACRGGTTLKNPLSFGSTFESGALKTTFKLSFYLHVTNSSEYTKVTYKLNNVNMQVDNGGSTNLVYFRIPETELNGAVAMSFEWDSTDERLDAHNLTTDYTNKEKDHLALMLYEVFIGESIWF